MSPSNDPLPYRYIHDDTYPARSLADLHGVPLSESATTANSDEDPAPRDPTELIRLVALANRAAAKTTEEAVAGLKHFITTTGASRRSQEQAGTVIGAGRPIPDVA